MSELQDHPVPDGEEGDEFALPQKLFDEILDAIETADAPRIDAILEPLHAADIADLLEQLDFRDRRSLLGLWTGMDGEVLSELDDNLREEVINELPADQLAEAVRELESDDVVDLVEDLESAQQDAVLRALDAPGRIAVEKALAYPEYSAGRLMQVEIVRMPEDWNVGQAIDFMRGEENLPDQFYHVVLVDVRLKPRGYVTLGRVLSHPREMPLKDLAEESFRTFHVEDKQGDVAYAFNQYHLISAPVVDDEERLVGVITIDDAMEVLDEEAEEDILRLAGVGIESEISDSTWGTVKQRLPWLAVNLLTAIIASVVISLFDETIAAVVALAILMPIVASMGGNAGTQSLTVAVRAIATRDLTGSNVWRVLRREMIVGLFNGVVFAAVMAAVGIVWFGSPALGGVIAAAMVINLVVAGLAGMGIPVLLDKLGVDPALASGTFVTTVTDVVGFFAFLGLAAMVLL
ncbi:magnesium transporter [Pseudoroseicyclus tamaricis]|uniref:Magnesium transporter MgtE n=1 Tax=Pseudoroseicyclus tamaricis TaxID=2705421 RepID=A0A6B2JZ93_9RHOB|nr:magnesium transporter [Pseudoroseicyclus tamaricis]NDV00692.1 magnesium transporter [Pseudoroseicyclus tamaricis]